MTSRSHDMSASTVHDVGYSFWSPSARTDLPPDQLARRDNVPAFPGKHANVSLTLHDLMIEDPEFFVEVVCDASKPASAENYVPLQTSKVEEPRRHFNS